jgi:hypothetical protein
MAVRLDQHARDRLAERGVLEAEVVSTVGGAQFTAKRGRTGFRRNFPFRGSWRGKSYATKQVLAYAVREESDWLVITVVAKFF